MNNQTTKDIQAETAPQQAPCFDVLSPEIISKQATINIGTLGYYAYGKSKLIQAISEVSRLCTLRDKPPSNITLLLYYASAKIFKCPKCPAPDCYKSYSSAKENNPNCPNEDCDAVLQLVRHISFVDYGDHEKFLTAMLAGTTMMDAALLLFNAKVPCPQRHTSENLNAIEMMNLQDGTIILQDNIDALGAEEDLAYKNHQEIKTFVEDTNLENAPIVPISSQLKYNLDAVCQYICEHIPVPIRDFTSSPEMIITRSFDLNKSGKGIDDLTGGIVGGSIVNGVLKVGDEIEIRPGNVVKDEKNRYLHCIPILSKVVGLFAGNINDRLDYAVSGGIIGVELAIDPSLAKYNKLVGNRLGLVHNMPEVYKEIEISYSLFKEVLGAQSQSTGIRVENITKGELLKINVGSSSIRGIVKSVDNQYIKIFLVSEPLCAKIGDKVTISRGINKRWRLIGIGELKSGKTLPVVHS